MLKEFAYGMFILDPLLTIWKMKYNVDTYTMLLLYGDMVGFPLVSPIYKLNLLIYLYGKIPNWKKEIIKEKDITEKLRG